MRRPSHRFIPAKGIKGDFPHHREGSTPYLHDLRTSPFPFVVPRQNGLSLKVHGLNFVAGDNETHNEGKVDSTLSALTSTTHNIRLFLERLPPPLPPPGGRGGYDNPRSRGITDTCSGTCSQPSLGSLLREFCVAEVFLSGSFLLRNPTIAFPDQVTYLNHAHQPPIIPQALSTVPSMLQG